LIQLFSKLGSISITHVPYVCITVNHFSISAVLKIGSWRFASTTCFF